MRTLVGHVDPTYDPAITVDIMASVTTPANAAGKVPMIIQWGNTALGSSFDDVPDPIAVKAKRPPPLTPLIDGDIAFRQHDQGHTDVPNWPTFIEFCSRYFTSPGVKR